MAFADVETWRLGEGAIMRGLDLRLGERETWRCGDLVMWWLGDLVKRWRGDLTRERFGDLLF